MCGISLFFDKKGSAERAIHDMVRQQQHRGPDDFGIWVDQTHQVALGHNRLSIIDLSALGHQPMFSGDGRVALVFNGEVYNYLELKRELEALGHQFTTKTDTEVVLRSYLQWGMDAPSRFNGMWAIFIVDLSRRLIFGSRDRMGIKPLYYHQDANRLVAASEVKAILGSGAVRAAPDLDALNEYFTFQNVISDKTLFSGVRLLPPGMNFSMDLSSGVFRTFQYWDMQYAPDSSIDEVEYSGEVRKAFHRAMARHLISDVPIGATVSGGMDSSAVVAIASQYIKGLHTFTGYFDTTQIEASDRCVSERDDARLISQHFSTIHHERLVSAQDVIDTLPMIVWHLEDPKVAMCYTFYTISQQVRSKVTVNLSGTGGDETYAGYPWRYQLIDKITDPRQFSNVYYEYWSRLVKDGDKARFFRPEVLSKMDLSRPRKEFDRIVAQGGEHLSSLNKALYFEAKTFLHGMLMVEDKMGMAFSLETRFPFLDNELVDLSLKIPDNLKYRNGEAKYLLKKSFHDLLPQEILHKRKQGFTPPDKTWYRWELEGYIASMLTGPKSLSREYVQPEFVEEVLQRHKSGSDERLLIWSLLFFEGWCRTFLANAPAPTMRLF
jgi:asparagine synthase (glutamine-hydrolysing)